MQRICNFLSQRLVSLICFGFLGYSPNSLAINFVSAPALNWIMIEAVPNGCVTQFKNQISNNIYVGACNQRAQPHGRGILFQDAQLYSVKANDGKIFSFELLTDDQKQRAEALNSLESFANKAEYIYRYNRVFLLPPTEKVNIPTLLDSPKWVAGDEFLKTYPHATSADVASIRQEMNLAQEATFSKGWGFVQSVRSSRDAQNFLNIWQNKARPDQLQNVQQALLEYANDEQVKRDEKSKRDAEIARLRDEQERARLADRARRSKMACVNFYPGYVGQYKGTGFFATYDAYVVRYVNKNVESVTIEATASGNSLSRGNMLELACVDLLDRTK